MQALGAPGVILAELVLYRLVENLRGQGYHHLDRPQGKRLTRASALVHGAPPSLDEFLEHVAVSEQLGSKGLAMRIDDLRNRDAAEEREDVHPQAPQVVGVGVIRERRFTDLPDTHPLEPPRGVEVEKRRRACSR